MKNKQYPLYKVEKIGTIKDLLHLCRDKYSPKRAFWFANNAGKICEISYYEFASDVIRISKCFLTNCENAHIGLYGENSYEWIVAYFAIVCSGNVVVPIDKELEADDVKGILLHADCTMLFYSQLYAEEVARMQMPDITKVSLKDFYNANRKNQADTLLESQITPETLAAIVYTSGTTGKPKGVMLTHENLASDAVSSSENLFVPEGTVLLLPLYHTFGMMAGVFCQLLRGYSVFINTSLRYLKRDLEIAKPRHLSVVPLVIASLNKGIWDGAKKQHKTALLKAMVLLSSFLLKCGIDLRKRLFKSVIDNLGGNLEMLISGGAAIDKTLIDGIEAFGIKTINGYGITECSPIVATTRNEHTNFPSVGCVVPNCSVRIENKGNDGIGEICISGSIVSKGYYKGSAAEQECFEGEWFKTGDLGCLNENNFLYITGRGKNLIILSNGKNVSPEELECRLQEIDNIDEVMVYAENEIITAEIFAENKNGIEDKIHALNKTLPSYKQIHKIKFRETEFEKTTTKKIRR